MAQQPVFHYAQGVLVTTEGPGKLHLYSYGANVNLPGVYGFVETARPGVSNFVISHSYFFTKYAFYWEGNGKAEFRIGQQPAKKPVGRNWNEASWLKWEDTEIWPLEVGPAYFQGAVNRDNLITCFLLPEYLVEN